MDMPCRKKLIEVALPLEAINKESAREKSIHNGCPNSLHLWGAIRSLAQSSAVLSLQQTRFDNGRYSCYKSTIPPAASVAGCEAITCRLCFFNRPVPIHPNSCYNMSTNITTFSLQRNR